MSAPYSLPPALYDKLISSIEALVGALTPLADLPIEGEPLQSGSLRFSDYVSDEEIISARAAIKAAKAAYLIADAMIAEGKK